MVKIAQVLGLEPRPTVLETAVLPLNYTCVFFYRAANLAYFFCPYNLNFDFFFIYGSNCEK